VANVLSTTSLAHAEASSDVFPASINVLYVAHQFINAFHVVFHTTAHHNSIYHEVLGVNCFFKTFSAIFFVAHHTRYFQAIHVPIQYHAYGTCDHTKSTQNLCVHTSDILNGSVLSTSCSALLNESVDVAFLTSSGE
jgi:hypothetical protein